MLIDTKAYGKIEINDKQQIHFPQGLLGFEYLKEFVLLDASQQPFFWLQSLEVREIAFVLINPHVFRPDYKPEVGQEVLEYIDLQKQEDLLVFAIVTIPEDQSRMTANLQGPILINKVTKLGTQAISKDNQWQIRHVIMDELKRQRGSSC